MTIRPCQSQTRSSPARARPPRPPPTARRAVGARRRAQAQSSIPSDRPATHGPWKTPFSARVFGRPGQKRKLDESPRAGMLARMRILYGVVGEGMGHATRSRVVLAHLLASGHEVKVV